MLPNDRCPNCSRLINENDYVTVGEKAFCSEQCFREWVSKDSKDKKDQEDLSVPFLR